MGFPRAATRLPPSDPVFVASAALLTLNGLHGLDHLRQGLGRLSPEVIVGGQALLLLALIPVALSFRRHRLAPLAGAAVGLWTALAVAASHLAPYWSAFSDPYRDSDLDIVSWGQMLLLIAAALTLAALGIRETRRRKGAVSA